MNNENDNDNNNSNAKLYVDMYNVRNAERSQDLPALPSSSGSAPSIRVPTQAGSRAWG